MRTRQKFSGKWEFWEVEGWLVAQVTFILLVLYDYLFIWRKPK